MKFLKHEGTKALRHKEEMKNGFFIRNTGRQERKSVKGELIAVHLESYLTALVAFWVPY